MGFEEKLAELTREVDKEIKLFFEQRLAWAKEIHPFLMTTYENLREYILRRGKKLASSCTLMACKGVRGFIDRKILRAAAAIEFFRHGIIAHDDLIDLDDMRRGKPSIHRVFEDIHRRRFGRGESERFGESMAVVAGNMMLGTCFELIAAAGFPEGPTKHVLHLIASELRKAYDGEVLDLIYESCEPSSDEWFAMGKIRGTCLFRASILTGAILGDADRERFDALEGYANNIGYAFDIQDDIIGSFATPEEYGRPPLGDMRLGKKPLFIVKTLELASESDRRRLRLILGNPEADRGELEELKAIALRSGGLDSAREVARTYAKRAKGSLERVRIDAEAREFFDGFADFIVESMRWYI